MSLCDDDFGGDGVGGDDHDSGVFLAIRSLATGRRRINM